MKRKAWQAAVLLFASLNMGCVERNFHINTDQPGALVYHNGEPIGTTPVDKAFVYYGKHQFMLVKDGYQTQNVVENVPAPWYEYPPLEFMVENLWPFTVHDRRDLQFTLFPMQREREDQVLIQSQLLRAQGQAIGVPGKPAVTPPVLGAPAPGTAPIPANPVQPPIAVGIPQSLPGTPLPGSFR